MKFSIVIPALNEESAIRRCLSHIPAGAEIIVADGGSRDRTVEIAEQAGAMVCRSRHGRGLQMNRGAALATGEVLLFLHADTLLPTGPLEMLARYFRDSRVQVGAFRLAFDARHPLLDLYAELTRFEFLLTGGGDQCITVRKTFFESLGGFPDWPLLEDIGFVRRARKLTRVHLFPATVLTSARRFRENGFLRQMALNIRCFSAYYLGIPPERLAAEYESARKKR